MSKKESRNGKGRVYNMNTVTSPLSKVLVEARLNKKLTLKDVANATGKSLQFISNIEHGRAPLPMNKVATFAKVLGLNKIELAKLVLENTHIYKEMVKLGLAA